MAQRIVEPLKGTAAPGLRAKVSDSSTCERGEVAFAGSCSLIKRCVPKQVCLLGQAMPEAHR